MAFSWNPFKAFKNDPIPDPIQDQTNKAIQQAAETHNPAFNVFEQVGNDIEEAVSMRSVVTQRHTDQYISNPIFTSVVNNMAVMPIATDKAERIRQYRSMACFSQCNWCLDEICDDFIHEDENGDFIWLKIPENKWTENAELKNEILQEHFKKYIGLFNLREEGYNYIKRFLIEGELAFENIVNVKRPELGIIGVKFIPAEYYETLIDVRTGRSTGIYIDTKKLEDDIRSILSQSYLGSQQVFNSILTTGTPQFNKEDCIPMFWPQVTYINTGDVSPDGTITYSILEKVKQAYHQLSLLQDAAVILRVTRAPERLLFNVSTGRMNENYATEYVRNFANSLKAKKVVGRPGPNGQRDIASVYNPVSMLESYVFGKSEANEGTTVESVGSSANYEEIGDIEYFLRLLMKEFKVPFSRYKTPENVAERDETISYEEYSHARQIIRFQRRFALGFKKGFITHLKLIGLWDKYELNESDITVEFMAPVLYDLYQTQKLMAVKMDTYSAIVDHEEFSKILAMKKILGYTDAEIEENFRELTREKQLVMLGDYYADQLNSEGPAVFDSPIPIKGKEEKMEPDEEDKGDEDSSDEGDKGDEDEKPAEPEEANEPPAPSFGLG